MFIKVVHQPGMFQMYECDSYQYREHRDEVPIDQGEDGTVREGPGVELLLTTDNQLSEAILLTPEMGNRKVYVLNGNGKTIDSHIIVW